MERFGVGGKGGLCRRSGGQGIQAGNGDRCACGIRRGIDNHRSITVKDASTDTVLDVDQTYYVPLLNRVTNQMDQMITVTLTDGVGPLSFTVTNPGVYGIRTDMILPAPTTAITGQTEIAIY